MTILGQKEFRPYLVYAPKKLLENQKDKGYTEVAFSIYRPLVDYFMNRKGRVVMPKMCSFFHPDGRVSTYEQRGIDDVSVIRFLKPWLNKFKDDKEHNERLKLFSVKLGKKRKIEDVLSDLIGWELR